jgi:hypothetical protein
MDKSRKDNMKKTRKIIILMNLLAVAACATAFGQAVTVTPPLFVETSERKDFIEKGMTQDMVSALIGSPDKMYWDNSEKTVYHAVYEYEVYKCSFSFTLESPQRTGSQFRETSKSKVEARYAASVAVYFYKNDGKWIVFKVIGSDKDYKAYRENGYNPLRRMCVPDDAVLVEQYR